MQNNKKTCFTPLLTTPAGSTLTLDNWEMLKVEAACYALDALLMKPGLSLLSKESLKAYGGWQGIGVLNASLLKANAEGVCTVRSIYDGSTHHLHFSQLYSLIVSLAPQVVILPEGFVNYLTANTQALPDGMEVFIPWQEEKPSMHYAGYYFAYDKSTSFSDFLAKLAHSEGKPCYGAGDFTLEDCMALKSSAAFSYIESDKPAKDAMEGVIYPNIQLLDEDMAHQHTLLAEDCACPTCKEGLTRAYLHHLLQHTPLLCQRFLIQHNAHYYQNVIAQA
ncbi:MAG: queuine tRNA-ribosyltransferase [Tatlockia sp.]